jgi:hypothetical protein
MVLSVFAGNKVVAYQLLGDTFRRRPGHQASLLRSYAWRSQPSKQRSLTGEAGRPIDLLRSAWRGDLPDGEAFPARFIRSRRLRGPSQTMKES